MEVWKQTISNVGKSKMEVWMLQLCWTNPICDIMLIANLQINFLYWLHTFQCYLLALGPFLLKGAKLNSDVSFWQFAYHWWFSSPYKNQPKINTPVMNEVSYLELIILKLRKFDCILEMFNNWSYSVSYNIAAKIINSELSRLKLLLISTSKSERVFVFISKTLS